MDVMLGQVSDRSVAPTVYGLVDRGCILRPDLAAQLRGRILIVFTEGYETVRVDFRGGSVMVSDDHLAEEGPADLEIHAELTDFVVVVSAPLAGGLPKPTEKRGRAALARIADGRVDFVGSIVMARKFLRLLTVSPVR